LHELAEGLIADPLSQMQERMRGSSPLSTRRRTTAVSQWFHLSGSKRLTIHHLMRKAIRRRYSPTDLTTSPQ
jgi:hypothetical protein